MTILLQGNSQMKTYVNNDLVDEASINIYSDDNGANLQTDFDGVTTYIQIPKDQLQNLLTIPARSQSLDAILKTNYPVSSRRHRRKTKRKRGRKAKKKSRKILFRKK